MKIYEGISAENVSLWRLDDEWIEIDTDFRKLLTTLHSSNFCGSLRQVSSKIGGKPLGMGLCPFGKLLAPPETSFLLGCFVGMELCPRFLATSDLSDRFTLYTKNHIIFNYSPERNLSDQSFDSTLERLKTLLWRV